MVRKLTTGMVAFAFSEGALGPESARLGVLRKLVAVGIMVTSIVTMAVSIGVIVSTALTFIE